MAWRYTFETGPEKPLKCKVTIYVIAAMRAFAQENIEKLPLVKMGIHPYDGHVLTLWDDKLVPEYGPYRYGIGLNEAGSLTIVNISDGERRASGE
jgi:hypothetical protein